MNNIDDHALRILQKDIPYILRRAWRLYQKWRRSNMSKLRYEPKSKAPLRLGSDIYPVFSLYSDESRNAKFLQLKANICDLNPALITKCLTGTEQDFIMLSRITTAIHHRARTLNRRNQDYIFLQENQELQVVHHLHIGNLHP